MDLVLAQAKGDMADLNVLDDFVGSVRSESSPVGELQHFSYLVLRGS